MKTNFNLNVDALLTVIGVISMTYLWFVNLELVRDILTMGEFTPYIVMTFIRAFTVVTVTPIALVIIYKRYC